jgi:hypothetical protein
MATYKYSGYLSASQDGAFDATHPPGAVTPFSGIYRCMGCGKEIVSEHGKPLPPQNHHQHAAGQGAIIWKLIVFADHNPKA